MADTHALKDKAWAIYSTIPGYPGILEDAKTGQLAIYASRSKARIIASRTDYVKVVGVRVRFSK